MEIVGIYRHRLGPAKDKRRAAKKEHDRQKGAKEIEMRTGFETRTVVLGHLQRGGSPTAYDRYLGLWFGATAMELADRGEFGKMVSLRGTEFVAVDLGEAVEKLRTVDPQQFEKARIFFG